MIPDDLLERANARAEELGWDLRWVDREGERKIIATDPNEPIPFNRVELTLGEAQSWHSAALELGLIEKVEIDDLFNMVELTGAIESETQVVIRLNDKTTWLGLVKEVGVTRKVLTLRCHVRQVPLDMVDPTAVRVEGHDKVIPANLVREIVYLKTSTCPGCSENFWFAPHESGGECPSCGAFIENEHQSAQGETLCENCGAIRPCKCDIWAQTIQARAEERRKNHGSWDCEMQGHALVVGHFKCEFCEQALEGIEWHGNALYMKNDEGNLYVQAHVSTAEIPIRTFTYKGQPFTVFDSLPDEQHLNTAKPECKNWHRFPSGQNTECVNCGLPEAEVPPDWHWVSDGEFIKAVAPVVTGEQRDIT